MSLFEEFNERVERLKKYQYYDQLNKREKILRFWESTGFLDSILIDQQIHLALRLEQSIKILIAKEEFIKQNNGKLFFINNNTELTGAVVNTIIRRIFVLIFENRHGHSDILNNEIKRIFKVKDLINFSSENVNKIKKVIEFSSSYCDVESESIVILENLFMSKLRAQARKNLKNRIVIGEKERKDIRILVQALCE